MKLGDSACYGDGNASVSKLRGDRACFLGCLLKDRRLPKARASSLGGLSLVRLGTSDFNVALFEIRTSPWTAHPCPHHNLCRPFDFGIAQPLKKNHKLRSYDRGIYPAHNLQGKQKSSARTVSGFEALVENVLGGLRSAWMTSASLRLSASTVFLVENWLALPHPPSNHVFNMTAV